MLLSAPSAKTLPGIGNHPRTHADKANNGHYPAEAECTCKRLVGKSFDTQGRNDLCQNGDTRQEEDNPVAYKMFKHGYPLADFEKQSISVYPV